MIPKHCPLCGSLSLEEHHGEYHFEPPPNVPRGTMTLPNSTWFACTNCGEEIMPHSLTCAIEAECRSRLAEPIAANP